MPAEGWNGVQGVQGDQAARQTAARATGGQGKLRRWRSTAPAELEVEDEFQGLVCKNRKV